eukprot:ANDGO_00408.mRNA.1 hypothetical protein
MVIPSDLIHTLLSLGYSPPSTLTPSHLDWVFPTTAAELLPIAGFLDYLCSLTPDLAVSDALQSEYNVLVRSGTARPLSSLPQSAVSRAAAAAAAAASVPLGTNTAAGGAGAMEVLQKRLGVLQSRRDALVASIKESQDRLDALRSRSRLLAAHSEHQNGHAVLAKARNAVHSASGKCTERVDRIVRAYAAHQIQHGNNRSSGSGGSTASAALVFSFGEAMSARDVELQIASYLQRSLENALHGGVPSYSAHHRKSPKMVVRGNHKIATANALYEARKRELDRLSLRAFPISVHDRIVSALFQRGIDLTRMGRNALTGGAAGVGGGGGGGVDASSVLLSDATRRRIAHVAATLGSLLSVHVLQQDYSAKKKRQASAIAVLERHVAYAASQHVRIAWLLAMLRWERDVASQDSAIIGSLIHWLDEEAAATAEKEREASHASLQPVERPAEPKGRKTTTPAAAALQGPGAHGLENVMAWSVQATLDLLAASAHLPSSFMSGSAGTHQHLAPAVELDYARHVPFSLATTFRILSQFCALSSGHSSQSACTVSNAVLGRLVDLVLLVQLTMQNGVSSVSKSLQVAQRGIMSDKLRSEHARVQSEMDRLGQIVERSVKAIAEDRDRDKDREMVVRILVGLFTNPEDLRAWRTALVERIRGRKA